MYKKIRGFTLIEMAIVLVVIGMIVGGITVGKTMLRQSQINSVMMDAQRYISAAVTFQQKYGSLPGDMANATSYWGSMTSSGLTCPPAANSGPASGTQTCNGDGNGCIYCYGYSNAVSEAEPLYFWQHLANAQLIQGNYTGIGLTTYNIGINIPASRLHGLGIGITQMGVLANGAAYASDTVFAGNYGHVMTLGAYQSYNSPVPAAAIMTTSEAQSFDSKYDDGAPATGNVLTWQNGSADAPNCASSTNPATAVYNTGSSYPGPQCSLILITGF